jgi:hypothetical protein
MILRTYVDFSTADNISIDDVSNFPRKSLVNFVAKLEAIMFGKGKERIGRSPRIGSDLVVERFLVVLQLFDLATQTLQLGFCLEFFLQRPEMMSATAKNYYLKLT